MSRDHRKLIVFHQADELIINVYAETSTFPPEERFGVCAQLRRAAVSTSANIVEGCARRSTRDYLRFIELALGSASETLYLLDLSSRLGFLTVEAYRRMEPEYRQLIKGLQKLINTLEPEA
jgi:four helix bundle protein